MKKLLSLFLCLIGFSALAQTRAIIIITITNNPVQDVAGLTNSTLTVNGTTLQWTNLLTPPLGYLAITNGTGSNAVNLAAALPNTLPATLTITPPGVGAVATNAVTIQGQFGQSLTITSTTNWCSITTNLQSGTTQIPVEIPMANYTTASNRLNVASQVVAGLNAYSTNQLIAALLTNNLFGVTYSNGFFFATTLTNSLVTNSTFGGGTINGATLTNVVSTNSTGLATTLVNPILTNGVNYSNAFSSPGTGTGAEQFGAGASAGALGATAIGANALASARSSLAVGSAQATNQDTIAIGDGSQAWHQDDIAIGFQARATNGAGIAIGVSARAANQSVAIGDAANNAGYANAAALGYNATNTAANQVMLAGPGVSTVVNGNLTVGTNATIGGNFQVLGVDTNKTVDGTNNWRGDVAFQFAANSGLVNGNNGGINVGSTATLTVSGPTGAFTLCGFAGGRDGKDLWIINLTGQTMTVANDSGFDISGNRIYTGINASVSSTNNPGLVHIRYSSTLAHWLVLGQSN